MGFSEDDWVESGELVCETDWTPEEFNRMLGRAACSMLAIIYQHEKVHGEIPPWMREASARYFEGIMPMPWDDAETWEKWDSNSVF